MIVYWQAILVTANLYYPMVREYWIIVYWQARLVTANLCYLVVRDYLIIVYWQASLFTDNLCYLVVRDYLSVYWKARLVTANLLYLVVRDWLFTGKRVLVTANLLYLVVRDWLFTGKIGALFSVISTVTADLQHLRPPRRKFYPWLFSFTRAVCGCMNAAIIIYVVPWLIERSRVALGCFTLFRLVILPDVSLLKPEDSFNQLFKAIFYSVSYMRHETCE